MAAAMTGIDWTAAKALGEGLAEGGPWPRIARLLAAFELGAVAGEGALIKRKIKDKEEQE